MKGAGSSPPWTAALIDAVSIGPARRDRELVLGRALRANHAVTELTWVGVGDPEIRRRLAYLVDVAQHFRGQTQREADQLERLRRSLPVRPPQSFWPGERPLPPGTDPIAERWGYCRGVDLLRLRAAMTGSLDLLPAGSSVQSDERGQT